MPLVRQACSIAVATLDAFASTDNAKMLGPLPDRDAIQKRYSMWYLNANQARSGELGKTGLQ